MSLKAAVWVWCVGAFLIIEGYEDPTPGSAFVFDISAGQPIPAAVVTLSRSDGVSIEAETDAKGRAAFADLKPATYRIRAEKAGYVNPLDPEGRGRLVLVSTARGTLGSIGLIRGAVITGQVSDHRGLPVDGAVVSAIARRGRRLDPRITSFGGPALTDDTGRYRLYGLPPGQYSIAVIGDRGASGPVYFPGSPDPKRAEFFELKAGETRSVDLALAAAEERSITGKVHGLSEADNGASIALVTRGAIEIPIADARTDASGSFVLRGVPSGEYRLMAWTPPGGANARAAVKTVIVTGTDLQVDVELGPLATVNGRLVWSGAAAGNYPCAGGKQISFRAEDAWSKIWAPTVEVNGDRFTAKGLPVGRYRIGMPGLAGSCRLAAIRVGDQTAPDGPIQIDGTTSLTLVLTTATGQISGAVVTQDDKPAAGIVVLSPTDSEGDPQVAQLDAEGRYEFSHVLVGDYLLMAMDSLTSTDYLDPVEAQTLGARVVTVKAGQTITSNLRLAQK